MRKILAQNLFVVFFGLFSCFNMQGQSSRVLTEYNFESEENITISDNGLWQIGTPSKSIFDSAYQGKRAIITDSVNLLPADTSSYFTITIDSAEIHHGSGTALEFWHYYDLNKASDTAYIEFSYDGGLNWYKGANNPLHYDFCYSRYFNSIQTLFMYPDTIISGNSGGWVKDRYDWTWYYCVSATKTTTDYIPDSIIVRFYIKTGESPGNVEGWMIDSIAVSYDLCFGATEMHQIDLDIYPNPFGSHLNIALENAFISSVEIYNSLGLLVKKESGMNQNNLVIETKELQEGAYFLRIIDNQENCILKSLIKTNN